MIQEMMGYKNNNLTIFLWIKKIIEIIIIELINGITKGMILLLIRILDKMIIIKIIDFHKVLKIDLIIGIIRINTHMIEIDLLNLIGITNIIQILTIIGRIVINGMIEIKSKIDKTKKIVMTGAYAINSEYKFRKGSDPMEGMKM